MNWNVCAHDGNMAIPPTMREKWPFSFINHKSESLVEQVLDASETSQQIGCLIGQVDGLGILS